MAFDLSLFFAFWAYYQSTLTTSFYAGAIGGILPDVLTWIGHGTKAKWSKVYDKFHLINWTVKYPYGYIIQLVTIFIFVLIYRYYFG